MDTSPEHPSWRSVEVDEGLAELIERGLAQDDASPLEVARFRKAVRVLLAENARLRSVLGHCPKGIAVLDEEGNVTGYNREFCQLLGCAPQLGEPIHRHFSETDRELLRSVVQRAGTTKRAAAVLRSEATADGAREIEFLAATLPSSTERSIGVVLAGDDRTADIADEHARLTYDDANRRDTFALALGRLSARPDGVCDVGEAARRAVRLAWVGPAKRAVTIDTQIDEGIRARIAERDLVQVLANIVGYAVATAKGRERFGWVTVSAEHSEERRVVEISVRDNGAGIEPHVLQRVLVLGDSVGEAEEGIGLAIARSIIQARGGAIRALSEPDRGTTVVLTLPAE